MNEGERVHPVDHPSQFIFRDRWVDIYVKFPGNNIFSHLLSRAPAYHLGLPDHLALHAIIYRPAHGANDRDAEAEQTTSQTTHGECNDDAYDAYDAIHNFSRRNTKGRRSIGPPTAYALLVIASPGLDPEAGVDIQVRKELLLRVTVFPILLPLVSPILKILQDGNQKNANLHADPEYPGSCHNLLHGTERV
jgi:hypothetical protein